MDAAAYYRSITQELLAVKDRVANVIDERHQGEIGSWRESLVRSLLRRHLPATMGVGQGFVLTGQGPTTQLDVIVYDLNYPKIVQEGEFVIVTPDAVRAIVEVKSSTSGDRLRKDLRKLSAAAVLCRMDAPPQQTPSPGVFVGYFAFTSPSTGTQRVIGEALRESVLHYPSPLEVDDLNILPANLNRVQHQRNQVRTQPSLAAINALALGPDQFVRYWTVAQERGGGRDQAGWKRYTLENLAYGYFLTNLIASVTPSSIDLNRTQWWPDDGKGTGEHIAYPNPADFATEWNFAIQRVRSQPARPRR